MIRLASPLKLSAIWIKYDLIKYSIACAPCWILEDSWPQFTWSVTNGHFEHFNWKRTSNHPENKALRILKRNPSNIQLHASKTSFQNGRIQIAGKPPEVGSANPTTCREKIVARRFSKGGHKKRIGVRTTGDTLKYIRSFAQRFELLMVWIKHGNIWKYLFFRKGYMAIRTCIWHGTSMHQSGKQQVN